MTNNSKKGFASPNYDEETAEEARKKGGLESSQSREGEKGGQASSQSDSAQTEAESIEDEMREQELRDFFGETQDDEYEDITGRSDK